MCIRVVILCYQHHQGATTSTYIVRVLCLVQVMWAGDIHLFHYYSFLHTQCNMLIYLLSHCIEILEHTTPSSSYAMPTERKLGNFFLICWQWQRLPKSCLPYFKWNSCWCLICVFYASCSTCWVKRSFVTHANKWDDKKWRKLKTDSGAFSKVKHKLLTSVVVLTIHALTSLLHMLQWSMQPNKKIHQY